MWKDERLVVNLVWSWADYLVDRRAVLMVSRSAGSWDDYSVVHLAAYLVGSLAVLLACVKVVMMDEQKVGH